MNCQDSRGVSLTKNSRFDDYLKKLNEQIAAQNRKWLEGVVEQIAAQANVDASQLSQSVQLDVPDVEHIATDILTQNSISEMLNEAVIEDVAIPAFADIMNDTLRKTIAKTNFVEAYLDCFKDLVAANGVAERCTEKLGELVAQHDVSKVVVDHMQTLAEQNEVSEDLGERFAELAGEKEFADEFDEAIKGIAAKMDFSKLLYESVEKSEALKPLHQIMRDLTNQADFSCLHENVRQELNRSYQSAVARLKRDIEIETYRHLPWDRFIDLTYGSLADDPIQRPEFVEPGVQDALE